MNGEDKKTILLVEDEAIIAMVEKMTLEKFGHKVITANTGEEAVTLVEKTSVIDLILMDIDLGAGIDGTEAAEIILQDRNIPIVFLSSHTEPEIVARTEKITAYGFIVKNSSDTVFQALIKMVFKLSESKSREKKKESREDVAFEALRESEAHAQALLRTIPDMLFRVDRQGVFLDFRADARELYTQSETTIIGARYRDVLPVGLSDLIDRKSRAALETGALQTFKYQLPVPGRGIRDYEARMAASGSDEVTAIVRDITERTQAEAALQKSELQLKAMLNSSPVVVLLIQEGKLIYLNPAAEKITGWKEEEFLGKNFTDFVHQDDIGIVIKNNKERMGGNSFLAPYIIRINKKTGGFIYAEVNGTVINLDGKPTMLGFLTDITERKWTEEALRRSEAKQSNALQMTKSGHWEYDVDRDLFTFNDNFYRIFRTTADAVGGYQISSGEYARRFCHSDDAAQVGEETRGAIASSDPNYSRQIEHRILYADGEVGYMAVRFFIVKDAQGRTVKTYGVNQDITERKWAEEEIRRQLEEKEILLKEVHHRIKNNFASIAGLLTLHMQSIAEPKAVAVLQEAIGRVNSMRLLYEKLLLSGDFQETSVKNYIESLAATVVSLFPGYAAVRLETKVDDFKLDPKRLFPLGIIINELLTNVMKYAFVKKKSGRITLSLVKENNQVTLVIQDNGVGLAEDVAGSETHGFGLTLVKMLSQQLDGSFSIEKSKGTRCKVEFTL